MFDFSWSRFHLCLQTRAKEQIPHFSPTKDPLDILQYSRIWSFSFTFTCSSTMETLSYVPHAQWQMQLRLPVEQSKDWTSTVGSLESYRNSVMSWRKMPGSPGWLICFSSSWETWPLSVIYRKYHRYTWNWGNFLHLPPDHLFTDFFFFSLICLGFTWYLLCYDARSVDRIVCQFSYPWKVVPDWTLKHYSSLII